MIRRAMLLAAGKGTRLKPFTDEHPKALFPLGTKTLLQRNIEYLKANGIEEIIVNVHHFASEVQTFLSSHDFGLPVTISDEREALLETGGGVKKAAWFFGTKDPFVVMNADILTDMNLRAMMQFHLEQDPLATLAVTTRESSRSFLFTPDGQLCGWRNQQTGKTRMSRDVHDIRPFSFSGIQIMKPQLLSLITREGAFSLVDVYLDLATSHRLLAYDHSDSLLLDVGSIEKAAIAEKFFP